MIRQGKRIVTAKTTSACRTGIAWSFSVIIILILSGCASRPIESQADYASSLTPDSWLSSSSTELVADDWLQEFKEPELGSLINEALVNNFGLESLLNQVDAAEAASRIVASSRFPQFNLGLNSGKQQNRFITLDIPGLGSNAVTSESHALSLGTSWEVDIWNRIGRNEAASIAQYEALQKDLEALRLSLAGQVAKAWLNAIEADQQYDLARETAQSFNTRLDSIERRYQRGLTAGFDLRLVRAQTATTRAAIQNRKSQRDASIRLLENLLGRYPSGKLEPQASLPELVESIPPGLPSDLLSRRPDLVSEERRLASALAQKEATQRNWLPRLVLTGSSGTTSNQLSDLLDEDFSVWSIFGDLSTSLFTAGRLKGERDQANANLKAQIAQYQAAVLNAFREVETALSADQDLADLEQEVALAAMENSKAETQAWDQYEKGLIDITSALDTQGRAFDAQSQLLSTRNQRLQNRVDLHLALGGGYGG